MIIIKKHSIILSFKYALLLFILVGLTACSVLPIRWADTDTFNHRGGAAISGYDPVSYHTQNKAIKGNQLFQTRWQNTNWRFSSEENMALFKLNPDQYAPEYGGYCARAVSLGFVNSVNPHAWLILDGKLLLFHNDSFRNAFMKRITKGIRKKANKNWLITL